MAASAAACQEAEAETTGRFNGTCAATFNSVYSGLSVRVCIHFLPVACWQTQMLLFPALNLDVNEIMLLPSALTCALWHGLKLIVLF